MVVLDLISNLTTTGSSCSPFHLRLQWGCGGPHPIAGVLNKAESHQALCERGSVWQIHVAGDCDLGQLYVFSVYFLSSQEYGKGWDTKELLFRTPGIPNPPAQCSSVCGLSAIFHNISRSQSYHRQPKLGHDVTVVIASLS